MTELIQELADKYDFVANRKMFRNRLKKWQVLKYEYPATRAAPTTSKSDEEWDAIKPLFLQLYLTEKLPLPKVMDELAKRRGFVASKSMFVTRIAKWHVSKYRKGDAAERTEREELEARAPLGPEGPHT